jgi:hypothetical protein
LFTKFTTRNKNRKKRKSKVYLTFNLSLYRLPSICILFRSPFTYYNKQIPSCQSETDWPGLIDESLGKHRLFIKKTILDCLSSLPLKTRKSKKKIEVFLSWQICASLKPGWVGWHPVMTLVCSKMRFLGTVLYHNINDIGNCHPSSTPSGEVESLYLPQDWDLHEFTESVFFHYQPWHVHRYVWLSGMYLSDIENIADRTCLTCYVVRRIGRSRHQERYKTNIFQKGWGVEELKIRRTVIHLYQHSTRDHVCSICTHSVHD